MKHANIVAVVPVLHSFPFYRDIQFFLSDGLKGIGLRQRYPNTGLAFDLWKFNSIDELELIRAFDDARIVSSASRNYDRQEKYQENQNSRGQLSNDILPYAGGNISRAHLFLGHTLLRVFRALLWRLRGFLRMFWMFLREYCRSRCEKQRHK